MLTVRELLQEAVKRMVRGSEWLTQEYVYEKVENFLAHNAISVSETNAILGLDNLPELEISVEESGGIFNITIPKQIIKEENGEEIIIIVNTKVIANSQVYGVENGQIEYSNENLGEHELIFIANEHKITPITLEVV